MAIRNATLEQLYHKVKEEEIITVSAKAAGEADMTHEGRYSSCHGHYIRVPRARSSLSAGASSSHVEPGLKS